MKSRFDTENPIMLIYAWHDTSDDLQYHGISNRGSVEAMTSPVIDEDVIDTNNNDIIENESNDEVNGDVQNDALVYSEASLGALTILWGSIEDELTIKLRISDDVWVGIGLEPEDGGMMNADMYLGFNDGSMKVIDCWSSGNWLFN